MAVQGNNIPNQNNLFELFKAQVDSLSTLQKIVIKAKIDDKTSKTISVAAESVVISAEAIYDALIKIGSKDAESFNEASKIFTTAITVFGNIFNLLDGLGKMGFGSVLIAKLRIWKLYKVTFSLMKFLWRVGIVPPITFLSANAIIRAMASSLGALIDIITQLDKLPPMFIAKRQIRKLYQIIFGYKPGMRVAKGSVGLYDIYKKLANAKLLKDIVKGGIAIKFMSSALKDLVKAVDLLGVSLPLIVFAWFGVKLLKPITDTLVHIFRKAGRRTKAIIKGSIALQFMVVSLMAFVGGMLLMGLAVVAGAKLIGVSLLVIAGIIGTIVIIGLLKHAINRGIKSIKRIGFAIAILTLVVVTMTLLATFIIANIKGFLVVSGFMILLVGAFMLLALASRSIKKGAKSLLLVVFCVGVLALIAVGMAFVGQFILGNIMGILSVMITMATIVGAVIAIGLLHKKIEKGAKAMIGVVLFSLAMTLVMLLLAQVANIADPLYMLEVAGIMALIIAAVGAAAYVAGKLEKKIVKGLPAMAIIVGVSLLMSLVMKNIAEAASIADPLDILAVAGIMALIIVAVGGIALAASMFVLGPQGIAFLAGAAAVATIGALALELSAAVKNMAEAAKSIEESGYKDATKLAEILKLPIKAIMGDEDDDDSVMANIKKLPGQMEMSKYTYKVKLLQYITSSIGGMADTLQHIASLNMPDPSAGYDENGRPKGWKQMSSEDFAMASQNASVILGMTSAMFGDEPTDFTLGDGSKFTTQVVNTQALEKVGLMVQWKVGRLSAIVGHIGNMADVLQHISSLNMPDPDAGYDENGKPKGWKQMKADDFKIASENAGSILTYFASLFSDKQVPVTVLGKQIMVGARNDMLASLDNISRSTRRKVDRLGEIVGYVGNMAVTLQNISSLKIPDPVAGYDENGKPKGWIQMGDTEFTKASENVSKIITTLIGTVSSEDLAKQLEDMDDDAAENFETIMGAMSGITGVTDLFKMLAGGEIPTKFDTVDGQRVPVEYMNIDKWLNANPDLDKTVKQMFDVVINAVAPYNHGKEESKLHDAEDEIGTIGKVVEGIRSPIETILSVYNDKLKDLDVINFEKLCKSTITYPVEQIGYIQDNYDIKTLKSGALPVYADIVKSMSGIKIDDKSAQNYQTNVKETVGLIKEIGRVDLNKLKTADNLMANIARLSKSIRGDFRELARVLNEELLETLKKLIDVFENPPQRSTPGENTASLKDATPDKSGTEGQAKKTTDNKDKDNAMAELAKELKSLNSKLTNLARLSFEDDKLKVTQQQWS